MYILCNVYLYAILSQAPPSWFVLSCSHSGQKNQSFVPQSFLVMWSEYSETGEQAEIDHSLSFFFQHQAIRTNIVDCN